MPHLLNYSQTVFIVDVQKAIEPDKKKMNHTEQAVFKKKFILSFYHSNILGKERDK